MSSFKIEDYEPTDADIARINQRMTNFNEKAGPGYVPVNRAFRIASEDGRTVGEAWAQEVWGIVTLEILHIDEALRGQGAGAAIMSAVEDFARARGAVRINLLSGSWMGEGFYEKHGYEEFDRVDLPIKINHSKPPQRLMYRKNLV